MADSEWDYFINIPFVGDAERNRVSALLQDYMNGDYDFDAIRPQGSKRYVVGDDMDEFLHELSTKVYAEDIDLIPFEPIEIPESGDQLKFEYEIDAPPDSVEDHIDIFYSKWKEKKEDNVFVEATRKGSIISKYSFLENNAGGATVQVSLHGSRDLEEVKEEYEKEMEQLKNLLED